jgi:hypothetical protein
MVEYSIDMRHIILLNTIDNLAPNLAYKGSNKHAYTTPSRKQRLSSPEQSQKPLIDSIKKAGRHFSPPTLSLPPEITLLYLQLSQKLSSVSHPNIHLAWLCKGGILFFSFSHPSKPLL